MLFSELSTSLAESGNLNLKIFELVASTTILRRAYYGDILYQGLELILLHTGLRKDLQFHEFVIAGFILIDKRVFIEQSWQVDVGLLEDVGDGRVGGVPELAEERSKVDHFESDVGWLN